MVCLSRPYHFRFFKGCGPEILFRPFLNILTRLLNYTKQTFYMIDDSILEFLSKDRKKNLLKSYGSGYTPFDLVCSMCCGLIPFEGAFFQCLSIGVLKSLAEKILGKIWSEIRGRLIHLFPMLHFDTPCKYQKTLRFCDISRGYWNVILVPSGLRDAKCYLKFVD